MSALCGMLCYNEVRKIGDFMKLTHLINGKVTSIHSDISNVSEKKEKNYDFFLDNIRNSIYITDRLIFIRESDDYIFTLEISDSSRSTLLLKKENMTFDINVVSAIYKDNKDSIDFSYKLESDDDEHQIILEIGD